MICEQQLALFFSRDTIHLLISHSIRLMLSALHAQMTAGGFSLQFYKITLFLWGRDKNLLDFHVKLLQLAFTQMAMVCGSGQKGRKAFLMPQHSIPSHLRSHLLQRHDIHSQVLPPCATYQDSHACRMAE